MNTEIMNLGGNPFFVRRWGDPALPKLLLLHGFPEYSGAWDGLARRLSDHFHCIAPDQRGYGQSWCPSDVDAYKPSELIADMSALIEALGGPVDVMGHDWGAAIAYGLAIRHPKLLRRLVIANGVHPGPFQKALAMGKAQTAASQYITYLRREGSEDRLAQDDFAKLRALFSEDMDFSWMTPELLLAYTTEWARPGRLRGMINWYRASPIAVGAVGERMDVPDLPVDKGTISMPHLLIWGAGDTALLPETTKGLEDYAPKLTRVNVADADHWIIHQRPDQVATAVRDFLA